MKLNLHILTESYPYGNEEVFVGEEIEVLKRYFNITYYPREIKQEIRIIPNGVSVNTILTKSSKFSKLLLSIRNFGFFKYWKFYLKRSEPNKIRSFRNFLGYCIDATSMAKQLNKLQLNSADILYSYWFKHTAFALALIDNDCVKVTRGHRTDIYEIEYSLPFHHYTSQYLDKIFPISEDGYQYLNKKYDISEKKLSISRLGTIRKYTIDRPKDDSIIRIVSCSSLIARKRVNKILDALKLVAKKTNKQIIWTHLGGGPLLNKLRLSAEDKPQNLTIHLAGQTTNDEVHKLYASDNYQCFINFSTSEGIPVSIMEAMSYGIPCIGTDVGGTREALTSECGILLDKDSNERDLAESTIKLLKSDIDYSTNCIARWNQYYSANENYKTFAYELKALSKSSQ